MEFWRTGRGDSRWIRWACLPAACLYLVFLASAQAGAINVAGHDVFILLDGGWRILNGQVPYRDFHSALGPLIYLFVAGGMLVTGGSPEGMAIANAAFGIVVGTWGWFLSRRRMPIVPALLFAAWLILTSTSPTPLGFPRTELSFAMIYNRQGYALLGLVLVECAFASDRSRFWGGVSSGIALMLLAFLKLNFFGAGALLVLATVPVRRAEASRAWGILCGALGTLAGFALYLRFAVAAFLFDMSTAIRSRGSGMSLKNGIAEFVGSTEQVTAAILTVVVTLLVMRGRSFRTHAIRTLLLGGVVLASCILFSESNSGEWIADTFTIPWVILLVGQLTVSYPQAKEKIAISVLVALSLGGVFAEFSQDAKSMMTLLRFQAPSVRSAGVSVAGRDMEGLRFYDVEQSQLAPLRWDRFDNGHNLVGFINDGVELLERSSRPDETVLTLSYYNPFSYILRRKPAIGGSTWLAPNNIDVYHPPDSSVLLGKADLIMETDYPSSEHLTDVALAQAFRPYLAQHFSLAARSQWWSLYRRHK